MCVRMVRPSSMCLSSGTPERVADLLLYSLRTVSYSSILQSAVPGRQTGCRLVSCVHRRGDPIGFLGTVHPRSHRTRFHTGEKSNDPEFAAALARCGDVYVNDAFGTAHRAHASTTGVAALLPAAAGRLLAGEIEALTAVRDDPHHPLVLVFGGAKVSDKVPMIRQFLGSADRILVGGGMAYTLLLADGQSVGNSRVETDLVETAAEILREARERGVEILLPTDSVCEAALADGVETEVCAGGVPEGLMGLDIGPASREVFARGIAGARTVIWNGPVGVFEIPAFAEGTRVVAQAIADLGDGARRVVGGLRSHFHRPQSHRLAGVR